MDRLELDDVLRRCVGAITNTAMVPVVWSYASLPVARGGLRIRRPNKLALSAYFVSIHLTEVLRKMIVTHIDGDEQVADATLAWCAQTGREGTAHPKDSEIMGLLSCGDGMPQSNLLESNAFRVAFALRLGAEICQPHIFQCGKLVDREGHYGLSCNTIPAGRSSRHSVLNDVIKRTLASASLSSKLEPPGLDRGNSLEPRQEDRCLHHVDKLPDKGFHLAKKLARERNLFYDRM
ncbi:hypothetical protein BV898_04130 [Hypsibius exemplaris]|uniref:Uncharacterized protein n=1 Tax=Hypsibius exemplaris TaxID=2072580 RepID=A0A1W0X2Z9_HYPEX|nr:hypothetical protein BV898_04130 [Hypsibius exemplaris]